MLLSCAYMTRYRFLAVLGLLGGAAKVPALAKPNLPVNCPVCSSPGDEIGALAFAVDGCGTNGSTACMAAANATQAPAVIWAPRWRLKICTGCHNLFVTERK